MAWRVVAERIVNLLVIPGETVVFNLSCFPGESYEANGFLVHNCSYGSGPASIRAGIENPPSSAWKNQALFDGKREMPRAKMLETVASLKALGVKAVELTGGGEPAAYRHFDELLEALGGLGIEVAMVSNGVLLSDERIARLAALPFAWARISIDAGTMQDYVAIRHCPGSHWVQAWYAVHALAMAKHHPEARVGVGFVVDRTNAGGLYEACRLSREHGADNVRLSMSFTPDGTERWRTLRETVREQAARAKADFAGEAFAIHDLTGERAQNVADAAQMYVFCAWKEVGCVIGADSNVYACCSWAYNPMGLVGSLEAQSFEALWLGEGRHWRARHDTRRDCRIHCLYWARNMEALRLMGDPEWERTVLAGPRPAHVEFI